MNKRFALGPALPGLLLLAACTAIAVQTATPEQGRALFESQALGTNGRSCASCHADGKGLDQSGDFTDAELKDIINACIRDALHGAKLNDDAAELDSLLLYIRDLQGVQHPRQ